MLTNIISKIICEEFENNPEFRQESGRVGIYRTSATNAMKVTFGLNPLDYGVEDGYRHLDILIFGGGCNYIKVYARLRWNVIEQEWLGGDGDGLLPGYDYVNGETPWRLYSDHDSCWRSDGVERLIWAFRDRLTTVGNAFNRWYTVETLNPEEVKFFMGGRERREKDGFSKEIQEQEFRFETPVKEK